MIKTKILRKAMHDIAAQRGEFTLFALLLREDGPGSWDLVVSAPWLAGGQLKATLEFVRLLAQAIGKRSLQQFARFVVLNSNDIPVKFILENIPVEDGEIHIQRTDLRSIQIEEGIIFRSMKPKPRAARLRNASAQSEKRSRKVGTTSSTSR